MKSFAVFVLVAAAITLTAKELPGMVRQTGQSPTITAPARLDPRIAALQQQMAAARGDVAAVKRLGEQVQAILLASQADNQGSAGGLVTPITRGAKTARLDGPDILIYPGSVEALAADWQMDGTMWVALSQNVDSGVRVYRSTDHGTTWAFHSGFYMNPRTLVNRLELVVGEGESAFVYTFAIHPNENGDLIAVRVPLAGGSLLGFDVHSGPDTVTDFTAGRDFTGSNYWLYAVSHNGLRAGQYPPSLLLRSTNYSKNWAVTDTAYNFARPMFQAGAGTYIYTASVPNQTYWPGWVGGMYSTLFGNPGTWNSLAF